jgi:hypothetical protein
MRIGSRTSPLPSTYYHRGCGQRRPSLLFLLRSRAGRALLSGCDGTLSDKGFAQGNGALSAEDPHMDDGVGEAYLVVGALFLLAWLGELLPSDAPVLVVSLGILVAIVIGILAWSAWQTLRRFSASIVRPFRTTAQRRELAELSNRQLNDVGIDLALAGRDKAVAVDRATLCRLLALSYG